MRVLGRPTTTSVSGLGFQRFGLESGVGTVDGVVPRAYLIALFDVAVLSEPFNSGTEEL